MKKNNIVWSIVALIVVWITGSFFYINNSSANPDYICIKNVSNSSCEIQSCDEWSAWERTCYGKRTTQVAYFLTRTTCESWYSRIRGWGYTSWNSWRKTADFTYATENCTIKQLDTQAPFWDTEVIVN